MLDESRGGDTEGYRLRLQNGVQRQGLGPYGSLTIAVEELSIGCLIT
ncbi:MAG: hypothetical protein AVDCRST_MAG37-2117 [uncultured Rubrobacteraceae bacterium]|uniref:Uncharacterized protein n=1 Tax=uncultured Rubrobacteraceae bacterium TaxID=349277 RepID=A0A6J4QVC6_9ACTN|nr:MAG: hypothetical protein AVDCRST_MAG37-2117 [uncultured Rubrobacteraceae bacterium]